MDKNLIFNFLTDLSANNSKEWMDKNRSRYNEAKTIWLNEINLILHRLAKYDPKLKNVFPKDTIDRINNNRRFHPNKPIYKDCFTFTPHKEMYFASFYISISPSYSFMGGGLYHPEADNLKKVREAIDYDGDKLGAIINEKNFVKLFGGLDRDENQLKTIPKGFPKDHIHSNLLRRKNFVARFTLTREQVVSDTFVDEVEKAYKTIRPMLDYLNTALSFEE